MSVIIVIVHLSTIKDVDEVEVQIFQASIKVPARRSPARHARIQTSNIEESIKVKSDERAWCGGLTSEFIDSDHQRVLISIHFNLMPFVVRQVAPNEHCVFPRNSLGTTKVDGKPKKLQKKIFFFSEKEIITMPPH